MASTPSQSSTSGAASPPSLRRRLHLPTRGCILSVVLRNIYTEGRDILGAVDDRSNVSGRERILIIQRANSKNGLPQ